jgi:SAM-dependent methyltransferase
MTYEKNSETSYWDEYYIDDNQVDFIPSQFAAFTISEMNDLNIKNIVDCGSGNGRDAIFFSRYGMNVIALDRSEKAMSLLQDKMHEIPNFNAYVHDVNYELPIEINNFTKNKVLYARFFLHSLDEDTLKAFIKNISLSMNNEDLFFVEYRDNNDKDLPKVTGKHFREYYSADKISSIASSNNLEIVYEVSGVGFAKYKDDDASVVRQIFSKNSN